jgi:hypothetical protein
MVWSSTIKIRMLGIWVVIPSSPLPVVWGVGQAKHGKDRQMELVKGIENACQGSLIPQLTVQGCDRGGRLLHGQADRHACQTVRPVWIDASLHPDLVSCGSIERDYIPERPIHHE